MTLDELITYYDGVYMATVALKRRIAALGPGSRPAVEAVTRYQSMARRYLDALRETAEMHERAREQG